MGSFRHVSPPSLYEYAIKYRSSFISTAVAWKVFPRREYSANMYETWYLTVVSACSIKTSDRRKAAKEDA